jgi:hypothetical protein
MWSSAKVFYWRCIQHTNKNGGGAADSSLLQNDQTGYGAQTAPLFNGQPGSLPREIRPRWEDNLSPSHSAEVNNYRSRTLLPPYAFMRQTRKT